MAVLTLVIPGGQSLSNGVDCGGGTILRLATPDAWSPPAVLTFLFSFDGVNYSDVFHVAVSTGPGPPYVPFEATLPVLPLNAAINMPTGTGSHVPFLRLRSGSRGAPVAQQADRQFVIEVA